MLQILFKKLAAYSIESEGVNPNAYSEDKTKEKEALEHKALKDKALKAAMCRQITPFGTLYW
tara:strand:+ start:208551 stop:208736 length:186 start_codon:yes stop_codon:yes gene_type:complete